MKKGGRPGATIQCGMKIKHVKRVTLKPTETKGKNRNELEQVIGKERRRRRTGDDEV